MRPDATKLLINYGADRTLTDIDGKTAEDIAVRAFWQEGPRILKESPSHQVDIKTTDSGLKTVKRTKRAANSNTVSNMLSLFIQIFIESYQKAKNKSYNK
jgi:hypothetical protein